MRSVGLPSHFSVYGGVGFGEFGLVDAGCGRGELLGILNKEIFETFHQSIYESNA